MVYPNLLLKAVNSWKKVEIAGWQGVKPLICQGHVYTWKWARDVLPYSALSTFKRWINLSVS